VGYVLTSVSVGIGLCMELLPWCWGPFLGVESFFFV
jgi:hypothetical protein